MAYLAYLAYLSLRDSAKSLGKSEHFNSLLQLQLFGSKEKFHSLFSLAMADPSISRWSAYWELYFPGVPEGPSSWKEHFGLSTLVLHYLWMQYALPAGISETDLLMLLFFMKCYPIATLAASRFNIHPSTFLRNVFSAAIRLSPVLNEVFKYIPSIPNSV